MMKNNLSTEYLKDITDVGLNKLVGYLPQDTIERCGSSPKILQQEALNKGLTTFLYSDKECDIFSGALYVADIEKMQMFLSLPPQKEVLKKYKIKNNASSFLQLIIHTQVLSSEKSDLYDLIALVFQDKRPEYSHRDAFKEVRNSINQLKNPLKKKLKI